MKSIYAWAKMLIFVMVGALSLTSCDKDEMKASNLDGTWEGNFFMFYETNDGVRTKRWMADYTVLEFVNTPFTNYGKGYQIDYFTSTYGKPGGCPIPEQFSYFKWEINDGNITLVYEDRAYLNTVIYDYHMSRTSFYGSIGDSMNQFTMTKVENYDWGTYQSYIDTYYYAKPRTGAEADSISAE